VEGVFTLKDGAIFGNTTPVSGGGVLVNTKAFTMEGGAIYGNTAKWGGGVQVEQSDSAFTLKGGRIQGGADSDGFAKNTATDEWAAFCVSKNPSAKWGAGGAYTKGGAAQSGGSDIGNSDDTLIAAPKGKR
jgi:hypothetical protein